MQIDGKLMSLKYKWEKEKEEEEVIILSWNHTEEK